jgi:hypothetical protein
MARDLWKISPLPQEDISETTAWREWLYQLGNKVTSMKMLTTTSDRLRTTSDYIVSTLPVNVPRGTRCFVTDALTPVFLSVAVGGGSVVSPVFYNGTSWVIG